MPTFQSYKKQKRKKKLAEEIILLLQGEKQRLSESPEVTQRSLATQVVHLSLRRVQSKPHSPRPLLCAYRYEDEINKRTAAENEFVALKKVGEMSSKEKIQNRI